jgi:putative inorganic carbon (HCO3(-)) transporter
MMRAQPLAALRAAPRLSAAEPAAATSARWSREWIYFAFVMVAWSFTPLLRRLIDYRNGAFNPVQVTSLLPFLVLLPLALFVFKKERFARLAPVVRYAAYVWIATFGYGFLLAAAVGSVGAAAFEFVQYLAPMLAGIWLAGQDMPAPAALRRLAQIVLPCAGIVAVYGIIQWVQPPPWDVLWVEGSRFVAADSPVPFGMRVFSTLNSPGPAADFFACTMIFALPLVRLRRVWVWPLMAAMGAALLLTLIREAWVALVVGTAVYLIVSPKRLNAVPTLLVLCLLIAGSALTLPALLGSGSASDVIVSRISTFGDVGHDSSAIARQGEISDALNQGLVNPLGAGLGNIGAAARLGSNSGSELGNVLDSGYLARFVELGLPGFLGYLAVVVGVPLLLAFGLGRIPRERPDSVDTKVVGAMAIAICAALAWSDAANDAHLGLDGLLFWLALGLGSLAAGVPVKAGAPRTRATWSRAKS